MHPKYLSINDYDYDLPEEKIAVYPLLERDQSKLLMYKDGRISEGIYRDIADFLPATSFLVFNDTKVIKARILFQKPTGATIEIFCLEPYEYIKDYAVVLQQQGTARWKCMIGGAGKWKEKSLRKVLTVSGEKVSLEAVLVERLSDAYVVELSWTPAHFSFAEILDRAGETPLPPYIKRKADERDAQRYQNIYSHYEGSVAAPTAGLHFTERIFSALAAKNIDSGFVTLHVGAGTFKPVKSGLMEGHEMHAEWIDVTVSFIEQLIDHLAHPVFCVGTTSVRTVESLYWMGLKAFQNQEMAFEDLKIRQWEVYEAPLAGSGVPVKESLAALVRYLNSKNLSRLLIQTQIIIAPGYSWKITCGMITNFHQPRSTLLLLVSAMIGDKWRDVYEHALSGGFRFLSYGDGCLIFRDSPSLG